MLLSYQLSSSPSMWLDLKSSSWSIVSSATLERTCMSQVPQPMFSLHGSSFYDTACIAQIFQRKWQIPENPFKKYEICSILHQFWFFLAMTGPASPSGRNEGIFQIFYEIKSNLISYILLNCFIGAKLCAEINHLRFFSSRFFQRGPNLQ